MPICFVSAPELMMVTKGFLPIMAILTKWGMGMNENGEFENRSTRIREEGGEEAVEASPAPMISRRKLLGSIGVTSIAVASGLLHDQVAYALQGGEVTQSVYGPGGGHPPGPGGTKARIYYSLVGIVETFANDLSKYDYVFVPFHTESGDGGGGMLFRTDTGSADNIRIYADSTSQLFQRVAAQAGPVNVRWAGARPGGSGAVNAAAFAAALETRQNVYVPAGEYEISDTIRIKYDGQSLFGDGTYNTTLLWTGTDSSHNMIELWSGRRDLGNNGLSVTNQRLENFKLSTKTGSAVNNVLWVEAGCFHGFIEKLRFFDLRGGVAQEAIIKYDSNGGQSYCLGMTMRDVIVTGGANDSLLPYPKGIWLESAIEAVFDHVHVYNVEEGWVFGTPVVERIRGVSNIRIIACQSEIGRRGYATDNGNALRFYQADNIVFIDCKIIAGASYTANTDQRPIRFSGTPHHTIPGTSFPNGPVTFTGGTVIWGMGRANCAVYFDATADRWDGVTFTAGIQFYRIRNYIVEIDSAVQPELYIDRETTDYENTIAGAIYLTNRSLATNLITSGQFHVRHDRVFAISQSAPTVLESFAGHRAGGMYMFRFADSNTTVNFSNSPSGAIIGNGGIPRTMSNEEMLIGYSDGTRMFCTIASRS